MTLDPFEKIRNACLRIGHIAAEHRTFGGHKAVMEALHDIEDAAKGLEDSRTLATARAGLADSERLDKAEKLGEEVRVSSGIVRVWAFRSQVYQKGDTLPTLRETIDSPNDGGFLTGKRTTPARTELIQRPETGSWVCSRCKTLNGAAVEYCDSDPTSGVQHARVWRPVGSPTPAHHVDGDPR